MGPTAPQTHILHVCTESVATCPSLHCASSAADEPRAMTPRRIAAARAKLDADRTALNTTKDLVEGERDKMAKDLEEREDELQKAQ